ncbi:kelch-like protein 24 [Glandiceps talaboti]
MLIDFAYTGHVYLNENTTESLLRVANQLQWEEVEDLGKAFLESQIDESNCLGISRFADSYGYTAISIKAKQFALNNFARITSEVDFLELDFAYLKSLFTEYMLVESEEVMLDAMFRWIRHDPTYRSHFMESLLELISLENLEDETISTISHLIPNLELSVVRETGVSRKARRYTQVMVFFGSNEMDERQRNVEIYNPTTKKWTVLSKLPSGADSFVSSVVPMGKDIWLSTLKRSTWMYSTKTDEWKQARSQPGRLLNQYAAAHHKGYVYVIGGNEDKTNVVKATVDRYDPKTDTWSMMSPMLLAVGTRAIVTWRNYFFVFGGWDGHTYTHNVQRYDIDTDEWKFVSRCPIRDTCGIGVVALDDFIYVLEGGEMFRYDPMNDSWRQMQSMNNPRTDFSTVVCNGRIHVMGGLYSGQTVMNIEVYKEEMNSWEVFDDLEDVTVFSYPRCVCVLKKNIHSLLYKYNKYDSGFQAFGNRQQSVSNYPVTSSESITSSLALMM